MPLFPVPELETPLLLQPVLPVPELGWQVDCGSRGRSEAGFGEEEEGTVSAGVGSCGGADCCGPNGEASARDSSSRIDSSGMFMASSITGLVVVIRRVRECGGTGESQRQRYRYYEQPRKVCTSKQERKKERKSPPGKQP